MKKLFLVAVIALTGCAGLEYATENYTGVAIQQHAYDDDTWRIFDKPNEERLMITPSIGAAMGAGMIQGLTYGLSGNMSGPQGAFRMAAASYLNSTGRDCQILDGSLIVDTQYEFFYDCSRR